MSIKHLIHTDWAVWYQTLAQDKEIILNMQLVNEVAPLLLVLVNNNNNEVVDINNINYVCVIIITRSFRKFCKLLIAK